MSTFHFLVEVDVERDTGKFVGRDEIADAIASALEDGADMASLSGLGADSASEYSVQSTNVSYMEKKELREAYDTYDQARIDEAPTDAELVKAVKDAVVARNTAEARIVQLEAQVARLQEERKVGETRVYQIQGSSYSDPKIYLADSQHDPIYFQRTEQWSDRWHVYMAKDGSLQIRTDTMGDYMCVVPKSSNEFEVRMVKR
jgi:hypothetical protein